MAADHHAFLRLRHCGRYCGPAAKRRWESLERSYHWLQLGRLEKRALARRHPHDGVGCGQVSFRRSGEMLQESKPNRSSGQGRGTPKSCAASKRCSHRSRPSIWAWTAPSGPPLGMRRPARQAARWLLSACPLPTVGRLGFLLRRLRRNPGVCFHQAQRRVIVGDGAAWIWNRFPGAIIRSHARAASGTPPRRSRHRPPQWARKRCGELEAGRIGRPSVPQGTVKALPWVTWKPIGTRYPQFVPGESGCKRIVGDRLKRGD